MISIAPPADFLAALGTAREVSLASYTLHPGPVLSALEAAARRGADVHVRLESNPYDDSGGRLSRTNAAAVAELRTAGAAAELTGPDEPALHLKAAVVDGVAWLDDRNWNGGAAERIVRDSRTADVTAVTAAVAGRPGESSGLATTKATAVRAEARLIDAAGPGPLVVESESFGPGPVASALRRRALAGRPTRLLVAGRELAQTRGHTERAALGRLAALGVEIRAGNPKHRDLDEKLAAGAGGAWCGSANATETFGPAGAQRDWGLTTRRPAMVATLRRAFDANWAAATPLDPQPAAKTSVAGGSTRTR